MRSATHLLALLRMQLLLAVFRLSRQLGDYLSRLALKVDLVVTKQLILYGVHFAS